MLVLRRDGTPPHNEVFIFWTEDDYTTVEAYEPNITECFLKISNNCTIVQSESGNIITLVKGRDKVIIRLLECSYKGCKIGFGAPRKISIRMGESNAVKRHTIHGRRSMASRTFRAISSKYTNTDDRNTQPSRADT